MAALDVDPFWVGYAMGYRQAHDAIAADWAEMARKAGDVLNGPTFAELAERRLVDHEPCRVHCGRCSRCIHADAYARRGGPYLGRQS
jgi:hypothetical protein